MKSNYNIKLLYLLAFFVLGTLASCSEDEDDLVLTEKVTLKLTSPLPTSVELGQSFTVNFTSNAEQVAISLAKKNKADSLFNEKTLESNDGTYSFTVDVPEDESWQGKYLLNIKATKGAESYAITREVIFGTVDEGEPGGIDRPENLYLVGKSSAAGWTPENGIPFTIHEKDGKVFHDLFTYLTVEATDDGFKVLPSQENWDGGYGLKDGEVSTSGDNFQIEEDGFYRIRFIEDDEAPEGFTYEVVKSEWSIIGNAAEGWEDGDDVVMAGPTAKGEYVWETTVTLVEDEFKFRENGGWDANFGYGGEEGKLAFNGGNNIVVTTPGEYVIKLDLNPEGYSYSMEEVTD